jgi:hypothetical protein
MIDEVIDALDVDRVVRVKNDYLDFNGSLKEGQLLKDFNYEALVNQQLFDIASMLHTGSYHASEIGEADSSMGMFERIKNRLLSPEKSAKHASQKPVKSSPNLTS